MNQFIIIFGCAGHSTAYLDKFEHHRSTIACSDDSLVHGHYPHRLTDAAAVQLFPGKKGVSVLATLINGKAS